jgi:hypothetical protein
MKAFTILALSLSVNLAFAQSELDNENHSKNRMERPANLPGTLIMRENIKTKELEVVHLQNEIEAKIEAAYEISKLAYQAVKPEQKYAQTEFNELDQDQAAESWYFYFGFNSYAYYGWGSYYYPTYNYYGYSYAYTPYYNYNYYGYNYYYYRPNRWGYRW